MMLYQNQLINEVARAMTKGKYNLFEGLNSALKFHFLHAHAQSMSDLFSKFQIPALNIVGGIAETQTALQSICMSFKGTFCNNDLNENSVSFTHMCNACLNYIASFKSLHQIL